MKWRRRSRVETRECLERVSRRSERKGEEVVDTSRLEIGSAAAAAAAALAVIAMITSAPGWLVYVRTVYTFPRVPYIGRFTARDARLRQRSVPVPVQRGGKILLNVEEITRRPPPPSRSLSRDRLLAPPRECLVLIARVTGKRGEMVARYGG